MTSVRRNRGLTAAGTGIAAVCLLLGACGSSPADSPRPDAESGSFEPDPFGNVPVPPDATPFGPVQTDGTTSSQSFHQVGVTTEEGITGYVRLATDAGWVVVSAPAPTGSTDWSAQLERDGTALLVTTAPSRDAPDSGIELSVEVTTA